MSKLTKDFLSSIPLGSRLIVKDIDDGDFEGTLNTPITFESSKTFTVTLDKCRRVGSSRFQPGSQEFDSETIEDIELINDATSDQGNLLQGIANRSDVAYSVVFKGSFFFRKY